MFSPYEQAVPVPMAVRTILTIAAGAGVVFHIAYFNKGEHHMTGFVYSNQHLMLRD